MHCQLALVTDAVFKGRFSFSLDKFFTNIIVGHRTLSVDYIVVHYM